MEQELKKERLEGKIKRLALTLGSLALLAAITAIAVTTREEPKKNSITVTTQAASEADAQMLGVPDERTTRGETTTYPATLVVPATQVTTEEESQSKAAQTSYMLPFGGQLGDDFSADAPVYNDVLGDWRTHNGVDFYGALGDVVKSAADGVVRELSASPTMGNIVRIEHSDGIVATYCSVDPVEDVKVGAIVEKGQMIGTLSVIPSERNASADHLHLEMTRDGELIDPLEVLGYSE